MTHEPVRPVGLRPERFGPYRVLERIAAGGTADVFRVTDERVFGSVLALKVIRPNKEGLGALRSLVEEEAAIASRMCHPNIARVVGVFGDDEVVALVLEYVGGVDLTRAYAVLRERRARFPLPIAIHILNEILLGLECAHRVTDEHGASLGVVHRDVSPGNVMVDEEGRVRLVDWGIARAQNRTPVTEAGQTRGKFRYMAPEQVRGEPAGPETDVYATAVTFWELVAGRRVYDDLDLPLLVMKVSRGEAPPLALARPELPPELIAIYQKATEKDRTKRYSDAGEFKDALKSVPIAIDADDVRARLSQLPAAWRLLHGQRRYERAVLHLRHAASIDLEAALMKALEAPDRIEAGAADVVAFDDAQSLRPARRPT